MSRASLVGFAVANHTFLIMRIESLATTGIGGFSSFVGGRNNAGGDRSQFCPMGHDLVRAAGRSTPELKPKSAVEAGSMMALAEG